ncbi:alpha-amylase [Deinococcus roseus]|uniref:Alpha-amylase n=2 Tax=Deinococcus roseus TaxID=392414 RepID=A0ABQ2CZM0_9DEIO|nr:alpha-amylase [Deinococcus roseus]
MQGEVVYQILVDRFADGDTSNNAAVNKDDLRAWHGGDLKGILQKIPYLKSLGVTTLWLTPIYTQQPINSFGTAGYHGYWPADFRNVDPHFGTLEDFQILVKTVHDNGMKIILDQVINHTGYEASLPKEKPEWFHGTGCESLGNPEVFCPLAGLPDLKQEKPEVKQFLLENDLFWQGLGVDGFRYDAIRHVPANFIQDLAAQDQKNNVFTLGEVFETVSVQKVASFQKLGLTSVFDFPLREAINQTVMKGAGFTQVRAILNQDKEYVNPAELAVFLDNHDVTRFASGNLFEAEGTRRTQYGIRALMTLRGIPVLYQGTEIAMRGGNDPDNRKDMRFEDQWTEAEKATYAVAQKAIAVRKSSEALSRGTLKLLEVPSAYGEELLLFIRDSGTEKVLVVWHNGKERRTFSLKMNVQSPLTQDMFGQDAKLSGSGGYLHLSLPPRSAAAFPFSE